MPCFIDLVKGTTTEMQVLQIPGASYAFPAFSHGQQKRESISALLKDIYDGCSFGPLDPPIRPRRSSKRRSVGRRHSIATSPGSSMYGSTSTSMTESDSDSEYDDDDGEYQGDLYMHDQEEASVYSTVVNVGSWQETFSSRSSFSCAGIQPISTLKIIMDGDIQAAEALEQMRQQRKALQETLEQYSITAAFAPSFQPAFKSPRAVQITPVFEKEIDPLEVYGQETFDRSFGGSLPYASSASALGITFSPRGELTPDKLPYLDWRLRALQANIDSAL